MVSRLRTSVSLHSPEQRSEPDTLVLPLDNKPRETNSDTILSVAWWHRGCRFCQGGAGPVDRPVGDESHMRLSGATVGAEVIVH